MSGARQPRYTWRYAAFEPDSGLSWRARLAAAVYCDYANGAGVLDPAPSIPTIADRMGVAAATAHRGRRELEQAGWLIVERRPGKPSRIVLSTVLPLSQGQDTPVQTPVQTPVSTPVSPRPEPREPREPGEAAAPEQALNSQLTSRSRHAIAAAIERREKARRGK